MVSPGCVVVVVVVDDVFERMKTTVSNRYLRRDVRLDAIEREIDL